jgi:hypothetical protein
MRFVYLAALLASSALAQTAVQIGSLKCPSTGTAAVIIPVGSGIVVGGVPLITFVCAALDSASFTLDKTTTPWTVRASSAAAGPREVRETPAGAINGVNQNFTLSASPASTTAGSVELNPTKLYLNGLLLTPCPVAAGANCDYQIAGTAILFTNGQKPLAGDLLTAVYWR